jgi:predicted GNAT family acetyltransferase/glutaredoxin
MNTIPKIKLYGAESCHKTRYYKGFLNEFGLSYQFLDIELKKENAEELRSLYENRKLNFPTITVGEKKLRNPNTEELNTWLDKLIPSRMAIVHDKTNKQFKLTINGEIAKVTYSISDRKMSLNHSEVPSVFRGQGIGKILVEKTFEKLIAENYTAVAVCRYIKVIAMRNEKWNAIIG